MCRISKSELFRTVGRREREKTKLCGAFRRGPGEKINFKERKQISLNNTPSAERVHIAFFGRRNAGKSSLINAVTGQKLSRVSDIAGTTTDPVKKAMELLPIGPVVIIDTPGLDDEGELGRMRVETSYRAMDMADIAVLVIDSSKGKSDCDRAAEEELKKRNIPYITAWNKSDLADIESGENEIAVSAKDNLNIYELKELIARPKGQADTAAAADNPRYPGLSRECGGGADRGTCRGACKARRTGAHGRDRQPGIRRGVKNRSGECAAHFIFDSFCEI